MPGVDHLGHVIKPLALLGGKAPSPCLVHRQECPGHSVIGGHRVLLDGVELLPDDEIPAFVLRVDHVLPEPIKISVNGMGVGMAPQAENTSLKIRESGIRILSPFMSSTFRTGVFGVGIIRFGRQ